MTAIRREEHNYEFCNVQKYMYLQEVHVCGQHFIAADYIEGSSEVMNGAVLSCFQCKFPGSD